MVEKVKCTYKKKANEKLVISFTYTVVDPRTVVVKVLTFAYLHTASTKMAVPDVLPLKDSAVMANVLSSVGLVYIIVRVYFDIARVLYAG